MSVQLIVSDELPLPGTSADVEIILTARNDVLRIPTSTLIEGDRVLLFDKGVLVEREVSTGLHNWDYTEILGGLREHDQVVSSLDRTEVVAGAEAEIADLEED